jgi:hypothetical protein
MTLEVRADLGRRRVVRPGTVHTSTDKENERGLSQDPNVEKNVAVLNVPEVVLDSFSPVELIPAAHLSPSRQARSDC